eukprot:6481062-Pyramimonas_sp.AAC.1
MDTRVLYTAAIKGTFTLPADRTNSVRGGGIYPRGVWTPLSTACQSEHGSQHTGSMPVWSPPTAATPDLCHLAALQPCRPFVCRPLSACPIGCDRGADTTSMLPVKKPANEERNQAPQWAARALDWFLRWVYTASPPAIGSRAA